MIGLAMSIIKFNSEVLGRVWAALLNLAFDVNLDDFSNLWKMYMVQAGLLIIPFFFYKLVVKRKDVELVQVMVQHNDRLSRANLRQTVHVDLNQALKSLRET